MRQTNFIIIRGNLVHTPEIRELPSGAKVCEFRLANNRAYTKDGQKVEKTCFIDVQAWDKSAEFVQSYVQKGDQVQALGELEYREYEKDGQKRHAYRVNAREVELIGKPKGREEQAAPAAKDDSDDLPFGMLMPFLLCLGAVGGMVA